MIILIIIFLIIIILLCGVKIKLNYEKTPNKIEGCLKILILKKIKIYSMNFPSKKSEDGKESKEKTEQLLSQLSYIKNFTDYIKTIIKSLKIKKIQNHLIFGLDDFADTGKYIGIIWGVFAMINSLNKNIKLSAEPTFSKFTLNAKGTNEFEIYPLKILIPTIKLLQNKEVRKFIKGVINERNS